MTQQPRRPRAPRLDPDQRRASILDAATELFAEQGPGFTTADLARAANVSEATIFRYFPDKPALVAATREALLGIDTLLPKLESARELPTLIQRLAAAGHALTPRLERTARVLADLDHHDKRGADAMAHLLGALTPLFDDEAVPGVAPDQLAAVFLGTLMANTVICVKAGVTPVDVDRLVDLVLHGMARRTDT